MSRFRFEYGRREIHTSFRGGSQVSGRIVNDDNGSETRYEATGVVSVSTKSAR